MIVIDSLKLNKFVDVRIPSNREYFSRFGIVAPNPQHFSGEDSAEPAFQSKLDSVGRSIEDYENYSRLMDSDNSNS